MKFRPLHDRVVVKRVEEEGKTKGGIIIPDTAKEKPMEGEIVAVGPGARGEDGTLHPLDVKPGDRVLFGKWSGTEIKLDGEELIIMKGRRCHGHHCPLKGTRSWLLKMYGSAPMPASGCCVASTFSPTRSG